MVWEGWGCSQDGSGQRLGGPQFQIPEPQRRGQSLKLMLLQALALPLARWLWAWRSHVNSPSVSLFTRKMEIASPHLVGLRRRISRLSGIQAVVFAISAFVLPILVSFP